MNKFIAFSVGSALWALSALPAIAQDSFVLSNGNLRSGVLDSTTMEWTGSNYGVLVTHDSADPDLFINSVTITGGTIWNPLIDFGVNLSYLGFTNGGFLQGNYTLGTAIGDDVSWTFDALAQRTGTINSDVAPGTYDFSVQMVGGHSSSATDILATFGLEIEVVSSITASVTASTSPGSVGWGESTDVSATMTNLGARNIVTSTWYVAGFGLGGPGASSDDQLILDSFQGNWFDQNIAGGASRTDLHSRWTSAVTNTPGTYSGNIGVIGGLYSGDVHAWRANPDVTVQVVPEPVSMIGLAAGVSMLARRRRTA